mgnify:CR=1 FL=1
MFEGLKKKLSELKSKKAENDNSDKKTSNKKSLKELFNKVFGEKISQ